MEEVQGSQPQTGKMVQLWPAVLVASIPIIVGLLIVMWWGSKEDQRHQRELADARYNSGVAVAQTFWVLTEYQKFTGSLPEEVSPLQTVERYVFAQQLLSKYQTLDWREKEAFLNVAGISEDSINESSQPVFHDLPRDEQQQVLDFQSDLNNRGLLVEPIYDKDDLSPLPSVGESKGGQDNASPQSGGEETPGQQ